MLTTHTVVGVVPMLVICPRRCAVLQDMRDPTVDHGVKRIYCDNPMTLEKQLGPIFGYTRSLYKKGKCARPCASTAACAVTARPAVTALPTHPAPSTARL